MAQNYTRVEVKIEDSFLDQIDHAAMEARMSRAEWIREACRSSTGCEFAKDRSNRMTCIEAGIVESAMCSRCIGISKKPKSKWWNLR